MVCPHCKRDVPDTNYKCPFCRGVLKSGFSPVDFQEGTEGRRVFNVLPVLLGGIIAGAGLIVFLLVQSGAGGKSSQSYSPEKRLVTPARDKSGGTGQDSGSYDTSDSHKTSQKFEEEPVYTYEYDEKKENDGDSSDPPQVSHTPGERVDIENFVHDGKITIFDFFSEYCGPCVLMAPKLKRLEQKRDDIFVVKIDINREGVRGIDWRSPVATQYRIRSIPYFIIYGEDGRRTHEGRSATRRVYQYLYEEGIR